MEERIKNEQELDLFFCGDNHGEWKFLVWLLTQKYKIKNANIVQLGDFGFGSFLKKAYYDDLYYKKLHNKLEKSNIYIYSIAGNHDQKSWFSEDNNYPRIKFLKDREIITLSGRTIYPISGAVSTDRSWRINYNKKLEKYGSSRRVWWSDEGVVKDYKNLPSNVDIIVSHTAPLCFEPVISRYQDMDDILYNDILEERRYLDYVFRNVRCKYWNYGHFHHSYTGSLENVLYKCLDINELYKLNK